MTKNITSYRRLTEYMTSSDADEAISGMRNYRGQREQAETLEWEINQYESLLVSLHSV